MTPFLHFRSWLRSGPTGERVLTAVVGAVLLSLALWASTPWTGASTSTLTSSGPGAAVNSASPNNPSAAASQAPGSARATGGGPTNPGAASGAVAPGGTTGTSTTLGGTGSSHGVPQTSACGPLRSTDQGVTATTIKIGIVIVDLGPANNLVAVPSAADQKKAHIAVFDDINKKGGVRCRKIVPVFYTDSVFDTTGEHSQCLQMQQDKVFAVFNNLFDSTEQACVAKEGIPNIWYTPPHITDVRKYAPYIMSWQPDFDTLIHQYVFGAKKLGYFDGMKKLGILKQSCFPDENTALDRDLRAVGLDPSKAAVFDYGCSKSPENPQADQQAALQFKGAGVTHVVNVAYLNDVNFATAADQQNYHPHFARMEDASATGMESSSTAPPKSYDGTLLITTIQTGAAHTPGYRFNKPTVECTKLLARAGLPSAYSKGVASLYGIACVDGALFKAMAERAPTLKRNQLAIGLSQLGALDLAYPAGPVDVRNPAVPTGGQLARPAVWVSSCQCWHLTDVRWHSY